MQLLMQKYGRRHWLAKCRLYRLTGEYDRLAAAQYMLAEIRRERHDHGRRP
jgi:hypothetical protein